MQSILGSIKSFFIAYRTHVTLLILGAFIGSAVALSILFFLRTKSPPSIMVEMTATTTASVATSTPASVSIINAPSKGASLSEELSVAEAALNAAKTELSSLERLSTTTVDTAAVVAAQANETSAQTVVRSGVRTAYDTSYKTVYNETDQFFMNPTSSSPQINFFFPNSGLATEINGERLSLQAMFSTWNTEINSTSFPTSNQTPTFAKDAESHLGSLLTFLKNLSTALTEAQSSSSISSYRVLVNDGIVSANDDLSNLVGAEAAEQSTLVTLVITEKPQPVASTTEAVAAQKNIVIADQAKVISLEAELKAK